ncbi:MAG TPA: ATP-binding cassette domain-containing protein [Thermoanaerobaculia bacterium]|nr:ATP-binding cassette domain-containing protein [Thermoanaerobaculia bacterium]
MIEAQNLTRRYGDFTAVDGVSFTAADHEILGMLGPNGAGKTTTIRMITGFLPPSAGRVTVAGRDLFEAPREARRHVGYLPENVALYPEMRVHEYLAYRALLEGLTGAAAREAIGEAVERCLLAEVREQIIGTLSKGFRQRTALATAILHRPRVLVLDEPTVGLDPKQIIAIRELIRELGRERTLLLSTHILPEVELLCDRVMIIDRGRIAAEGTPESLRESWVGNPSVKVAFKGEPADAAAVLGQLAGVREVRPGPSGPGSLVLECERGADPREEVFHAAVEHGWTLLELTPERASLEDVFVRLTTRDTSAEEPGPAAAAGDASDASESEPAPAGAEAEARGAAGHEEVPS